MVRGDWDAKKRGVADVRQRLAEADRTTRPTSPKNTLKERMAHPSLVAELPPVRGVLQENTPLAPFTWLRVGGPAQVLFLPADEADLARFLAETPDDIPVTVLGAASNVIVRDGGIAGVVVRLTPAFGAVGVEELEVRAGAAALDKKVAHTAAAAGVAGLEFFVGVPGTVGGALRMNAGCYGAETRDRLRRVTALDRAGRRIVTTPDELGYAYRHSDAPADWIFVEALFEGEADDPAAIAARMDAITEKRSATQPIREKTGGSTFKNPAPPGTPDPRSAWRLIDAAGGRGLRMGGAMMSPQHCNFMINAAEASAADLEALGEEIRRRVHANAGVDLEWELRRIGIGCAPATAARFSPQ